MMHITIARATLGAVVRTAVRYGPAAARAYRTTSSARTRFGARDSMRESRGSFVYMPAYTPEERWWE